MAEERSKLGEEPEYKEAMDENSLILQLKTGMHLSKHLEAATTRAAGTTRLSVGRPLGIYVVLVIIGALLGTFGTFIYLPNFEQVLRSKITWITRSHKDRVQPSSNVGQRTIKEPSERERRQNASIPAHYVRGVEQTGIKKQMASLPVEKGLKKNRVHPSSNVGQSTIKEPSERERRQNASIPADFVGGLEQTGIEKQMALVPVEEGLKKQSPPRHIFILRGRAGLGNRLFTLGNLLHRMKKAPSVELAIDWTDMAWRGDFWSFFDFSGPSEPRHLHSTREAMRFLEGAHAKTFPTQKERLSDLLGGHSGKAALCDYPLGGGASRTVGGKPASKNCAILTRDFRSFFKAAKKDSHGAQTLKHSLVCFYFNFRPKPFLDELMGTLVLTPLVRDYISSAHAAAGLHEHPYIGVHVRATDKKVGVEPLFERVRAASRKSPKSRIFFATDNVAVLKRARGLWGERLVSLSHLVPVRGQGGMHHQEDKVLVVQNLSKAQLNMDVILDLVSLACSATLVASKSSTLAQVAYFLNSDMEALKRFSGLDCIERKRRFRKKEKMGKWKRAKHDQGI